MHFTLHRPVQSFCYSRVYFPRTASSTIGTAEYSRIFLVRQKGCEMAACSAGVKCCRCAIDTRYQTLYYFICIFDTMYYVCVCQKRIAHICPLRFCSHLRTQFRTIRTIRWRCRKCRHTSQNLVAGGYTNKSHGASTGTSEKGTKGGRKPTRDTNEN